MTRKERKQLGQTLAKALAQLVTPEARSGVIVAKQVLGDWIDETQGFAAWCEYEKGWRDETNKEKDA